MNQLLPTCTDVFVIGGGPAGLAAAIAARRRGFEVTLADCSTPPIDKACGEGIMPDGIAAAESLGIPLATSEAQPFHGIRFCDRGVTVQAAFQHGPGLALRRTALHQVMVRHAADADIRLVWGARVTGIGEEGVFADGRLVRARWIVGADGGHSLVRRWAGLDACKCDSRRFGFRRHYQVAPWTEFVEIDWGEACQLYITPVAAREICVVVLSRNPHLRVEDALAQFPEVSVRLRTEAPCGPAPQRAGVTASRRLKSVCNRRVALVGDASGSVDAVTGEGLCLLFQQSLALASALEAGDLSRYQARHRLLGRRPHFMADLMLLLDRYSGLRRRVIRAFASNPRLFEGMLAMHVGEASPSDFVVNGLDLGWHMLRTAGRAQ